MADANEKKCMNCGETLPESHDTALCPECGQTYWKCGDCGYTLTAPTAPNTCPSCNKDCEFKNITCYTPDCGGPGNIDPRL